MSYEPKSFEDLLKEVEEEYKAHQRIEEEVSEDDLYCDFPISDTVDCQILLHRDIHFGGSFPHMIEYYEKGGKGVAPDITTDRIRYLAAIEKDHGENLAANYFSSWETEQVTRGRELYKQLRNLYENNDEGSFVPKLIADLILSEEEEPEKEILALIEQGPMIIPLLADLLRSERFQDPLSPGYGTAPQNAARCLGKMKHADAIPHLFESLGSDDFAMESTATKALLEIGDSAEEFLQTRLQSQPLGNDNEWAALALSRFPLNPKTAELALKQLEKEEVRRLDTLAPYLVLLCEALQEETLRRHFLSLIESPETPKYLHLDMQTVANSWENES